MLTLAMFNAFGIIFKFKYIKMSGMHSEIASSAGQGKGLYAHRITLIKQFYDECSIRIVDCSVRTNSISFKFAYL